MIADADGRLLEGAYTSLLWWEGETLCAVPDDAPILPGITRALLIELAGTVELRRPAPSDLAGRETWLVSALHGIRAVTRWVGGPEPGEAPRAATWQRRLESLAQPAVADTGRAAPPPQANGDVAQIGCVRPFTGIRSRSGPKVGEPPETPVR